MRLVMTLEVRFECSPDRVIWGPAGAAHAILWEEALKIFDHVRIVSRIRPVLEPSPGYISIQNDRISFGAIPYYLGPIQYTLRQGAVRNAVRKAVSAEDAVLLQGGGSPAS